MNILDLILVGCLAWVVLKGWRMGLLRSLAGLVGIVLAYVLGLAYGGAAAAWMTGNPERIDGWVALVGFLLVFVATVIAFHLAGRVLHNVLQATPFGVFDALGGAAVGLAKGVLILGLLLILLHANPIHTRLPAFVDGSALGPPVQRTALVLVDGIKALAPRAGHLLEEMGVHPPDAPALPIVEKISDEAGQARAKLDSLVEQSRQRLDTKE